MSEEMIVAASADVLANLPSQAVTANDKVLSEITTSGDYLPYLQILGSNTACVQRGEQPVGSWGLTLQKNMQNLGRAITCLILSWRPKAMKYDPVEVYYKVDDPKFKEIVEKSDRPNAGCGYGPEFLLWLPDHKKFATYFCGNKTARREAPTLTGVTKTPKKQCQIQIHLIEGGNGYKWHGPKVMAYDMPITVMPPLEELQKWIAKFNNPPESETEQAEAPSSDRG